MKALSQHNNKTYDHKPSLLVEYQGDNKNVLLEDVKNSELVIKSTLFKFIFFEDEKQTENLFEQRRNFFYAAYSFRKDVKRPKVLITDFCIPLSKLSIIADETEKEMLENNERTKGKYQIYDLIIMHAGDGNIHFNIPYDPDNLDEKNDVFRIYKNIVDLTVKEGF
jgi:FAD/FMN-containing dehydrogenase